MKLISRTQHLIFKRKGDKPTLPLGGVTPVDPRWKPDNIMPGEWAYNQVDDIWYYNNGDEIVPFTGAIPPAIITPEGVALFDPDKEPDAEGFAYRAGNTFVSYVNPSNPEFEEEALYRCAVDAFPGESPETYPEKWVYQGSSVGVSVGNLASIFYNTEEAIKIITGYSHNNTAINIATGDIYIYKDGAVYGLKPNDSDEGRWVKQKTLNYSNISKIITENTEGDSFVHYKKHFYIPVGNGVITTYAGEIDLCDENGLSIEESVIFNSPSIIFRKGVSEFDVFPLVTGSKWGHGFYDDWYVPATFELAALSNVHDNPDFNLREEFYWTSNERNETEAYGQIMGGAIDQYRDKSSLQYVRLIRRVSTTDSVSIGMDYGGGKVFNIDGNTVYIVSMEEDRREFGLVGVKLLDFSEYYGYLNTKRLRKELAEQGETNKAAQFYINKENPEYLAPLGIVQAKEITIKSEDFEGNLDQSVDNVQKLAEKVDRLTLDEETGIFRGGELIQDEKIVLKDKALNVRLNTLIFGDGVNGTVHVITKTDDGYFVGGDFSEYNGVPVGNIVKTKLDGTIDETFSASMDSWVMTIVVQSDGKVVVGGYFTTCNGSPVERIAFLNPDGSFAEDSSNAFSGAVRKIVALPDDSLLVGGEFWSYKGSPYNHFVKLNPDGSIDSFNLGAGFNDHVYAIATHGDKILVGGRFSYYQGVESRGFIKLNADGTIDKYYDFYEIALDIAVRDDDYYVVGINDSWVVSPSEASKFSPSFGGSSVVVRGLNVFVGSGRNIIHYRTDGTLFRVISVGDDIKAITDDFVVGGAFGLVKINSGDGTRAGIEVELDERAGYNLLPSKELLDENSFIAKGHLGSMAYMNFWKDTQDKYRDLPDSHKLDKSIIHFII